MKEIQKEYNYIIKKAEDIALETLVLFLAAFILAMFIYISICNQDFMWLARSGSIVVLLSAWMQARNYSIQQKLHSLSQGSLSYVGAYEYFNWQLPKARKNIEKLTLFMLVAGTLIWGFGDLLG